MTRRRGNPRVPTTTVRDHLAPMVDAGISHDAIAITAGVSDGTIRNILGQHNPTVRADTAHLLLAVDYRRAFTTQLHLGQPVPAIGTTRRLQALHTLGWNSRNIGQALNLTQSVIWRYTHGHHRLVTVPRWQAVSDFYDAHWSTPVPCGNPWAVGQASRARSVAASHGWAVPLAWDDERIDDPAATAEGMEEVA